MSCTVEHSHNSPRFSPSAGLGREPHAACSARPGLGARPRDQPRDQPRPRSAPFPGRARSFPFPGRSTGPPRRPPRVLQAGAGAGRCGERGPRPEAGPARLWGPSPGACPGAPGGPCPGHTPSLLAPKPNAFFLPSGVATPPCQSQPGLRCFLPCFLQTVTWFLVSALF